MKTSFILICIFINLPFLAKSQNVRIGMSGGIGWGKLTADDLVEGEYGSLWRFTGEVGFFIEKNVEPNLDFSIGLNFTQINSTGLFLVKRQTNAILIFGPSSNLPTVDDLTRTEEEGGNTITYASIPILFKYRAVNFNWRFGLQAMLKSRAYTDIERQQINLEDVRGYDFGPRGGLGVVLSSDLNFFADYYIGLMNASENVNALKRYNRQFLIGLNYYLK